MKLKTVRHSVCFILGWLVGPYLGALWIELLVALGVRMDFTLWDWMFRIIAIALFELLWPRAITLVDRLIGRVQLLK